MTISIVSALMKAEDSQRAPLFSFLDYAFRKLHNEAQLKMSLFLQSLQSLLSSLLDVIQNHKQELQSLPSPKYSLFSNYYNFFMWAFLRLVKILKYNLSSQDSNTTVLLSFYQEKVLPIFSTEPLDIFVKGQFYQGFKDSFCSSVTTTFTNLKDTFLIFHINFNNILLSSSNDDPYQLFINFRMASSFIRSNSHKKELIDFSNSQEIQDFQNDFLSLITCPSQKEPHQVLKLKYVGVFLLNLLGLNLPTDPSLAKPFLQFFMQNWRVTTAWDLNFLRETLWPLVEKTELDCFYECLNSLKESIAEFRYPSLNLNDDLLKKVKDNVEAKEKFYKVIIESSFIQIEKNFAKIWNFEHINPFNDPETVQVLQKQINIFICFLLPWISKFAKILAPETTPGDKEKLQAISDKLILLHSHPMFTFTGLVENQEDVNLLKEYRNIYRSTPFAQFLNPLTVIQSLRAQIDEANQALVSGLLLKKDVAQLKMCFAQEEQRGFGTNQISKIIIKDYNQDQNPLMILIQPLSLNFLKFNKILSYSQSFKGIQSDLTHLEFFLKGLDEFLLNIISLFDNSDATSEETENNVENFLTNCFEFLGNSIKHFSSASDDVTKLFLNFYQNLLRKSKERSWNFSHRFYGIVFRSISALKFSEATPKKIITRIFFEYQVWADHIEKIQNFANSRILTQNINLVSHFFKKLNRDIFMNSVFRDYPQEFIKATLFGIISYVKQKLINLSASVWEIIPENSDMIHILLKEIFIVFLNSFSSLNQFHTTATKEIKNKIVRLQEQFQKTSQEIETQQTAFQNLQTNLDLSSQEKGETLNQSLETIETLKAKISQAQQDLKTYEQNLQDLLDENSPIIEIFQAVTDQFALIFPFNCVLSDSELINSFTISQKSIQIFISHFHNFNQKKILKDNVVNNILTLHNYSHTLTNLLLCFPQQIFEKESFFLSFFASSQSLFQTFFDSHELILKKKDKLIKSHNFFAKLATLVGEAAGISLSFYKAMFFNQPQATFPDISKPILEWIETILKMFSLYQNSFSLSLFDPESLSRNLFAALIGFMQLLQVSDPETAFEEFIKKSSSPIRTLLSSTRTSPWGQSFFVLIVSFFDDFFRSSFSPELEIPQRIKQYLISHTTEKLKLANLCENVSLIREKELLCMELMVSSLQNHFHFERHQNNLFITIGSLFFSKISLMFHRSFKRNRNSHITNSKHPPESLFQLDSCSETPP